MQFNAAMNVNFGQWKMVKSERRNHFNEFTGVNDDTSKFGAGSGYENSAFYVFVHAADGAIDACPLNEWYNLEPVQSPKPLSAKGAEDESGSRNNAMNLLSLMSGKRLQGDDDQRPDPRSVKVSVDPDATELNEAAAAKKGNELMKIDMDDWINDISDSDEDKKPKSKENENGGDTKKAKKKGQRVKPTKKRMLSECAGEASNDGSKEVRELGHISVSNDKFVQEKKPVKSDEKDDEAKSKKMANDAKEAQVARDKKKWTELRKKLKEEKTGKNIHWNVEWNI